MHYKPHQNISQRTTKKSLNLILVIHPCRGGGGAKLLVWQSPVNLLDIVMGNCGKKQYVSQILVRQLSNPFTRFRHPCLNPIPHGLFSYLIHMAMAYDKPSLRFHNSKMHIYTKISFYMLSYMCTLSKNHSRSLLNFFLIGTPTLNHVYYNTN